MTNKLKILSIVIGSLIFVTNCYADKNPNKQIPSLTIDKNNISISGLSSGGFMAVQMQVAYSGLFKGGAGIVAGGPYYCAENNFSFTLTRCTLPNSQSDIPLKHLLDITNTWAESGFIDSTANLAQEKVYLFSGTQDSVVYPKVMDSLFEYYKAYVDPSKIYYRKDIPAQHAMITDYYGNSCETFGSPYINNCNFDLAGQILSYLYGKLNPRNNAELSGKIYPIDQTQYLKDHGFGKTGYMYVPATCSSGQMCKLHVALHGCLQNSSFIGDQYYKNTGYNKWADTNNMVILYPQTGETAVNGCWDWWGYDDPNYAKKSGRQMRALYSMIEAIAH